MVTINGVDLSVRTFGDPGLPPLVIVHGGPTWDHSYLLPAVAELADVAHVVLFDLRGCGRSHRTPPVGDLPVDALQPEFLADDVAGLIRHLGVPRADVLGFSYGGRIALRVVEQHPEVVGRLVLASTTAYADIADEVAASADRRERSALCPRGSTSTTRRRGLLPSGGSFKRARVAAAARAWSPRGSRVRG